MSTLGAALTIFALASGPRLTPVVETRCEVVEVGNVYDGDGNLTLEQIVWWEYQDDHYEVVDWKLTKNVGKPIAHQGCWLVVWLENERLIVVRAESRYESWLQYDSEHVRRANFSEDRRRKIAK